MWWISVVSLLLCLFAQTGQAAVFNRIGGDGGDEQENVSCPRGQYAVGIATYDDGNVISQIRLRCAAVNPANGNWSGRAAWTNRSPTQRLGGTSGLRSRSARCPRDQFLAPVVKGHLGRFFLAEVVSGLRVRCVRYSSVDSQTGSARRVLGSERLLGARFSGPQQTSAGQGRLRGDTAVHRINVRYGHAVDAIRVHDLLMPWYQAPPSQNLPPSLPVSASPGGSAGGGAPAANRPDLLANMRSVLWRYDGTTTHRGRSYRRVPNAFCADGMSRSRGSLAATKQFTLPAIEYDVVNAGAAGAARNNVEVRFGGVVSNRDAPALAAGARARQTLTRASVRRCVTSGDVPGGCYECAGSSAYEDPPLQITVDSRGAVAESNEQNNRLSR